MAADPTNLYVTAWGIGPRTGRVIAIPKAGGPAVDLATGLGEPWGIAVDESGVYVTDHADGALIAIPRL